jgi:hypothetical protein
VDVWEEWAIYNLALCGRAKKNQKTSDLIQAALYRFVAWVSGKGNIMRAPFGPWSTRSRTSRSKSSTAPAAKVSAIDAGEALLMRARGALAAVEDAENTAHGADRISGVLRVALATARAGSWTVSV